jgi:hypothetical protein
MDRAPLALLLCTAGLNRFPTGLVTNRQAGNGHKCGTQAEKMYAVRKMVYCTVEEVDFYPVTSFK